MEENEKRGEDERMGEDKTGEDKKKRRGVSDGLRQGLGALSAMRDAIEETISEARDRGDLSADRAKVAMRRALDRAQSAAGDARERFDFPTQKDFDALAARVAAVESHLGIEPAVPDPEEGPGKTEERPATDP